ncbi:MAG: hypothetical protein JWL96_1, partial [Sphingomonas bacterium]|uniref:hypothetical protein n=1 Tax=Sphingomonas bacterium TaxID=1895847 RepID=UPI00262F59AB
MSKSLKILWSGTAIGAALLLAACHPGNQSNADGNSYALPALPATLPLAAGAATAPTYAPSADALPAARRLRTVRVADPRNAYAYADDAWDFGDAIFDAPPDYGFDYAGTEPWAWQGYDQSLTFVEPINDGYRYYYYRPGADEPYFIRDADYGYGYDGDQLAVIYGPGGAILPYDSYGPRIDYASRYLARARDLYAASRERDRRAVNAANWAARAAAISAAQSRWAGERARQSGWRDYHQRVAPVADRHWQEERVRRQADAQRFAAWRQTDYRAAPPPRVIPAAWQQARWARDNQRYVTLPARQQAAGLRDAGAEQQRRAQDQATRQQADRQRAFGQQQRQADAQVEAAQRQQQQTLVQQQLRAQHEQQRAGDMARIQADRAGRQAAIGQQRAQMQARHDTQPQQAQGQARDTQRAQMQAQRAQADAARVQAQAGAREQARAAQAAARGQARAQEQAAGQAQQQARA